MPRFGKGKPMGQQAQAVLKGFLDLSSRHAAKLAGTVKGSQATGKIHSLRTFEKYADCLKLAGKWGRQHASVRFLKDLTPALAQAYLEDRAAQGIGQKQLDADRNALSFITGRDTLERVYALTPAERSSRAYTVAQVAAIAARQSEPNAIATELAHRSGIRAHELLTIRPATEAQASAHRTWRGDRFDGREGVRYVVEGKGGLRREVIVDRELSRRLEAHRLDASKQVSDRGVFYTQHYDIGGGKAWSQSVSDAAGRALGWSNGAHGLRHSYAQERIAELQNLGKVYNDAREIVSQELGHFRADVVETYLR